MKIQVVIGVLLVIILLLLYGYIPIKVAGRPATPQALLSRPLAAYTSEALARADQMTRSQLLIEKARSDYYVAIYNRQYKEAYAFLPKKLQEHLSQSDFATEHENFLGKNRPSSDVVTLGKINGIRILREYDIKVNDEQCKATVVAFNIDSTVKGKQGPLQAFATLDIWGSDGSIAYVIPGNLAQLSASY